MSKSIYEEAVETLNKYRNQNYNSNNKDEVELANAINVILPNYVKQEQLLELYKGQLELTKRHHLHDVRRLKLSDSELLSLLNRQLEIESQIKELENEKK